MRQLLALTNDFIIETKFIADTVVNEKSGYYDPKWIDESKTKASGKMNTDRIEMLVQIYDREGYNTNSYQKVWLDKNDIIKLADKIKEIDAIVCDGVPGDDLPF